MAKDEEVEWRRMRRLKSLAYGTYSNKLYKLAYSAYLVIGVSTCLRLLRNELLQVAVPSATFLRSLYTWYVSVQARNNTIRSREV